MRHLILEEKDKYDVALLIKDSAFNKQELERYYLTDIQSSTIAFSLEYNEGNKAPVGLCKRALETVLKACKHVGVTTLLVADASYFKVLTKTTKAEPFYGYVRDCKISGYEDMKVVLTYNYQTLFYKPENISIINRTIDTLNNHINSTYKEPGLDIIKYEDYPSKWNRIKSWLKKLNTYTNLTCDIETTGLALYTSKIVSISFAWNKEEGIAFIVDDYVKPILKRFFEEYSGTLIYHNATFDISHIIANLFMNSLKDYEGLLHGLDSVTENIDDTMIISYLATNNCSGNELSLKKLGQEYAGNYALLDDDVVILNHNIKDILKYNLVDTLTTWFVFHTYYPMMVKDNQLDIYNNLFKPSIRNVCHMQLIGFPMDYSQIESTAKEMRDIQSKWLKKLHRYKAVKKCEWELQRKAFIKKNNELKVKYISLENFETKLNPNSGPQLITLLYETMGFEVTNTTEKGNPSTDGDTLEAMYKQLIHQYEINEDEL